MYKKDINLIMNWPRHLGHFCNYYWYDVCEEKHSLQIRIEIEEGQKTKSTKKEEKKHKIHLTNVISVAIVAA